jgi:hypothetical protein
VAAAPFARALRLSRSDRTHRTGLTLHTHHSGAWIARNQQGEVGYIVCDDIVLVSYLVSAEELLEMMKKTTLEVGGCRDACRWLSHLPPASFSRSKWRQRLVAIPSRPPRPAAETVGLVVVVVDLWSKPIPTYFSCSSCLIAIQQTPRLLEAAVVPAYRRC